LLVGCCVVIALQRWRQRDSATAASAAVAAARLREVGGSLAAARISVGGSETARCSLAAVRRRWQHQRSATARRWRQLGGGASDGDGDKEGDGEYNNQI
jgi:hypothetical protein